MGIVGTTTNAHDGHEYMVSTIRVLAPWLWGWWKSGVFPRANKFKKLLAIHTKSKAHAEKAHALLLDIVRTTPPERDQWIDAFTAAARKVPEIIGDTAYHHDMREWRREIERRIRRRDPNFPGFR